MKQVTNDVSGPLIEKKFSTDFWLYKNVCFRVCEEILHKYTTAADFFFFDITTCAVCSYCATPWENLSYRILLACVYLLSSTFMYTFTWKTHNSMYIFPAKYRVPQLCIQNGLTFKVLYNGQCKAYQEFFWAASAAVSIMISGTQIYNYHY